MTRHIADGFHQPPRAAAIDVPSVRLFKNGPQVEAGVRIAEVVVYLDIRPVQVRSQLFEDRRCLGGLARVVPLPRRGRELAERSDH
ncbi:hypothetical protein G6F63_015770 [Rhizopus arrhizus]|nr:hypothetical protein G6F63_015770 [Rhizopus arrhizus]